MAPKALAKKTTKKSAAHAPKTAARKPAVKPVSPEEKEEAKKKKATKLAEFKDGMVKAAKEAKEVHPRSCQTAKGNKVLALQEPGNLESNQHLNNGASPRDTVSNSNTNNEESAGK